ncbi:DUF2196 domain-containing protein, partial [Chloroflexota bacterium]
MVKSLEVGSWVFGIVCNAPLFHMLNTRILREYDDRKDKVSSMSCTKRVNIRPGLHVSIILKKDQQSGILSEGRSQ